MCVKASSSYFLVCYLLVSSLQLSFGPHCRLVSICDVVSCPRMPRTCESIARLKLNINSAPSAVIYSIFALGFAHIFWNLAFIKAKKGCKNCVNTNILCDQPATNAAIYYVFCFAFKNTGICIVLCISSRIGIYSIFWVSRKNISIHSIFCVFALSPQKTLKRKNAVIYNILLVSKS